MAIAPPSEPVGVAVFARAPRPGSVKTRLIPALGAVAAARLHRRLTLHALAVAATAAVGPVTLWAASEPGHRFFLALTRRGLALREQSGSDLGERMHASFAASAQPLLLIGSDCPALEAADLRACAERLRQGDDAVFLPAEDGGYVLVGLRRPRPQLFAGIDWGSDRVMAQTRRRLDDLGLRWSEPRQLWDVDRPEDLVRLTAAGISLS